MAGCCDPRAPKAIPLLVNGRQVGIVGLEQAVLEVQSKGMIDEDQIAGELLRLVKQKNYVPESAAEHYRQALLAYYRQYGQKVNMQNQERSAGQMQIKVLGPGCKKCKAMYEAVQKALAATGVEAEVMKVENPAQIAEHGVLLTPGLMINGQLKVSGRVPGQAEIEKWIKEGV
ncbi:thioredoxin family protein [Desulfurispora thermophila]|uniref:thioredoxin family protein n=1 Tax=Desulfurispora thermophila TaxID=265470 RepID=UPI00037E769C